MLAAGKSGKVNLLEELSMLVQRRKGGEAAPKPRGKGFGQSQGRAGSDAKKNPKDSGKGTKGRLPRIEESAWKGHVITEKDLQRTLHGGEAPGGVATVVPDFEAVSSIRAMAAAHSIKTKYALVVVSGDAKCPEDLPKTTLQDTMQFKEGAQKAWVVPLADELPELPKLRKTTCQAQVNETAKAVRIVIDKRFVAPGRWGEIERAPGKYVTSVMNGKCDVEGKEYGWKIIGEDLIMGYVKTSDKVIDELLATSGTLGGLFVKPLKADEGRFAKFYEPPVEWYTKGDGEKAYDYYCRVRADAIKKSKPMTSRRGHGNALGVVGSEEAMKQKKRKRWVAQGVPDDWNPTTIERWLQSQGWTGVDALSAPRWRGQGWLFTGGQPISLDGGGEGPVCYEFDNFQILVRQWVPARMQTRGQSIDVRPCWFQTTKEDPKKDQTKKREAGEEPKAAEKGTMQVDSTGKAATDDDASADTKKMRTNDGEAKGTKTVDGKGATPVPERRWGETTGNTQHREQFKWPTKGPMGLKMMELGGTGDCGLRSLAYAKARLVNAKEPKEEAMAKAVKRSISTRTMIYEAFKKDKGWREGWAPSPEATFTTEGGKPATNAEEYLEAVKRPTKWLDWRMVDKAAKVLGRDVLLYSTENKPTIGHWWGERRRTRGGTSTRPASRSCFATTGTISARWTTPRARSSRTPCRRRG